MAKRRRTEGQAARDAALAGVLQEEQALWKDSAYASIRTLLPCVMTGEEIRLSVTDEIGVPHHYNVWGAIINGALQQGLICAMGETGRMRTRRSHARRTPLYRVGTGCVEVQAEVAPVRLDSTALREALGNLQEMLRHARGERLRADLWATMQILAQPLGENLYVLRLGDDG